MARWMHRPSQPNVVWCSTVPASMSVWLWKENVPVTWTLSISGVSVNHFSGLPLRVRPTLGVSNK